VVGRGGGSSTPSYKKAVTSRGKKPMEEVRSDDEGNESREEEKDEDKHRGNKRKKDKEENDKEKGAKTKAQKGPCKPKSEVTPRVVLNDPALQAHRHHMQTYAIICKFMGVWPTEKALQTWIKYHWKPKGSTDLHLGSKGFFTVVFTNIEDKDRVFEGGPYFYIVVGLYMRP